MAKLHVKPLHLVENLLVTFICRRGAAFRNVLNSRTCGGGRSRAAEGDAVVHATRRSGNAQWIVKVRNLSRFSYLGLIVAPPQWNMRGAEEVRQQKSFVSTLLGKEANHELDWSRRV